MPYPDHRAVALAFLGLAAAGVRRATAARTLHQEGETGSIEVGKLADLVVLDRNLFQISADGYTSPG